MAEQEAVSLMLQAEKALPQPFRPELVAYCPNMDMIAIVSEDESLDVYRLNGQKAFTRKKKGVTSKVTGLTWKYNGKAVVVAYADFTVDIIDTETGKADPQELSQPTQNTESERIVCLNWASNYIDIKSVKAKVDSSNDHLGELSNDRTTEAWNASMDKIDLNDVLQGHLDPQGLDPTPELPDQLALLDPERVLPRLPVLTAPSVGPLARQTFSVLEIFTSQASIDHTFHSQHLEYTNAINPLLLCHADGSITPTVYASLDGHRVRLPNGCNKEPSDSITHATHPYSRTHCFLMKAAQHDGRTGQVPGPEYALRLVPMTFRYIASAGLQVHLIGMKQQQLQHLSRYVTECIRTLSAHWYQSQELPSRFIRNINETLSEKGEGDLVQNLYQLAVTGHCPPVLKEWLTDELTESGHKRWDHAVTQGYIKVLEITHENLIPAIDRLSMVVSLLRGHAAFDDSLAIFDTEQQHFTRILETLTSLRLLAQNILIYAAEDRRHFGAFSKWLRHEIDNQASASSNVQASEEAADRAAGINFAHVLQYIQGSFSSSKLDQLLRRQPKVEEDSDATKMEAPTADDLHHALIALKSAQPSDLHVLDTWVYATRLLTQCRYVLAQATKWQASNTKINPGLVLEWKKMSHMRDMRMIHESGTKDDQLSTYTATVLESHQDRHKVYLHRIVHSTVFENPDKDVSDRSSAIVWLPSDFTVKDLKFIDDTDLMLLATQKDTSYLISIPYTTRTTTNPKGLEYRSSSASKGHWPPEDSQRHREMLTLPGDLDPFIRHVFPSKDLFKPLRIEVNGRKHRRVVCVISEDKRHYRVYDLDFKEGKERGGRRDASDGGDMSEGSEEGGDIEMTG